MDTKIIKPEDNKGGTFTQIITVAETTEAYVSPVPAQAPGIIWAEPGTDNEEAIYYKTRDAGAGTVSGLTRDFTNLNGGTGIQHENGSDWEVLQSAVIIQNIIDAINEGYYEEQQTIARVDNTSFTVEGNYANKYTKGRVVRFNQSSSYVGIANTATYSAGTGLTTVVVTEVIIPATITNVEIAIMPYGATNLYAKGSDIQNLTPVYAADGEASDTYAVTLSTVPTAYTTGMLVVFKANTVNTAAATLNVNELGAKTIKKNVTEDLANGDIQANGINAVIYDGTNFQLISRNTLKGYIDLTDGATVNIDLSLGNKFKLKEMGGNRAFTLSNVKLGKIFMVKIQQDGTGTRTITHPYGEEDFEDTAITTGDDTIDIAIDLPTGTKIQISTDDTLPTGISATTDYFVIRESATQIKIATSLANAQAGTAIDITAAGTGTHHMQIYPKWTGGEEPDESTDKYYWDTFGFEVLEINSTDSGSFLLEGHAIDIGAI